MTYSLKINNIPTIRYTAAERSKIVSSLLLPSTLLETVQSQFIPYNGNELKENVVEGKLDNYLISWLCKPEEAYKSRNVLIVLRKDLLNILPPYALISLNTNP
jgi:hypothetical protein